MDLSKLLGQAQELQRQMQTRVQETQEKLGNITVQAEAGAGMVKVEVNGHREVVGFIVDPDLLRPENKALLQDLAMGAMNKALADIDARIKQEMQQATQGLMPNIPGLNLSF